MKTISNTLLITAGLFVLAQSTMAAPSKYTANYVRGHSVTEIGKGVSVDVSWVQPVQRAKTDDFVVYTVHTWDERENLPGGTMPVVMAAADAAKFVKRYETSPDVEKRRGPGGADMETRRLKAVLQEGEGDRKILYLDLTDGEAAKAKFKITADQPGPGAGPSLRDRIRAKVKAKGKGKGKG